MIKKILISITIILLFVALIMLVLHFWIEADKERCMNMPFSEMMNDRSCAPYWEALDE